VVVLCLLALAVTVVIVFVAGLHKNSQISRLRSDGVHVPVTVTGCLGLLGGSGSNQAGYSCRGTFTVDGRSYTESIPGNVDRPPGTVLRAVTVPGDPALVITAHDLASEHTSGKVFILPTILLLLLVILIGTVFFWWRRPRGSPGRGSN
jgi:hypothetical protein